MPSIDSTRAGCYDETMEIIRSRNLRDRVVTIAAVVLPLAVAAVLVPFRTTLPSTVAVLLLVTVVVAVAANGQRVAGLLAAISAAAWFDFFLTQPYERFAITHREDIETTVLLVAVGAAVTELAVRGRRHKSVAKTEAGYLVAIRTTADLVASGASSTDVISLVRRQLTELLTLRECRFQRGRLGGLPTFDSDGNVLWAGSTLDVDRVGLPADPIELRAMCNNRALGRFVLTFEPGSRPGELPRQVAVILANQAGDALSREQQFSSGRRGYATN